MANCDEKSQILDILQKWQFLLGQRAGRELWSDKPKNIQDEDISNFNKDMENVMSFVNESIKLPCKVGDKMFYIPPLKDNIIPVKVIMLKKEEEKSLVLGLSANGKYFVNRYVEEIGKTLFFTKSEAEKRL